MRYALDKNDKKIEVCYSGELAKCEICKSQVKGRKGEQRIKHWYHHERKTIDCDNWHEPITEWHLKWQNLFPKKNREVTITENNISHRADIQLDNGLVIEVQNSPIKFSDIEKRESFYGEKGLIWVLNGQNLCKNSFFIDNTYYYTRELLITIPKLISDVNNYDYSKIIEKILNETEIGLLRQDKNLFEEQNNIIKFKFIDNVFNDSGLIEIQYKYYIACVFERLYGQKKMTNFKSLINFSYTGINEKIVDYSILKRYWKKFIDKMKYKVYIDNLNNLDNKYIYHYNENKIIDREQFIKEQLRHT